MSFAISTSLKAIAIAGLAGVAIAVPLSLPKSNGLSIDKEVLIQVNTQQSQQSGGAGSTIHVVQQHSSNNCRSIASHIFYFQEKKNLLLCSPKSSPSLPIFYFYETTSTNTNTTVTVRAQKVKTVSSKSTMDMGSNQLSLSILLENGETKELTPTNLNNSDWTGVKDLNPETECTIETTNNEQTLSCYKKQGNSNVGKIASWTTTK